MESSYKQLLRLVLPQGILDYFKVTKVIHTSEQLDIQLEELNIIPEEFANEHLISKGFLEEIRIQDFPIRGKGVYLFVKRRRWTNETSGNICLSQLGLCIKRNTNNERIRVFFKNYCSILSL